MSGRTAIIRAEGEGDAVWFNNDLFTFKATSDETDQAFTLFEERSQRGKVTPLHLHPSADETFWVIDGEIRVHVDGAERTVVRGGVASVPRGMTSGPRPRRLTPHLPRSRVSVPRTVSRCLIRAFTAGQPRRHRPEPAKHDRPLWPSDSPT